MNAAEENLRGRETNTVGKSGRGRAWMYAVPMVTLLAGFLFATSAQIAHGTDLRVGRRAELTDLIAEQERDGRRYRARIAELSSEIDAMSARAAAHDSRVSAARERARNYESPAGFTAVEGSGLRVILDDAPQTAPGRELPRNPTPNDLVVHQQDVQAVVNALWAGGAEAIEIMDQRIINTSAIRCVGNTLILHGVVYSPPYTIAAVGDAESMRDALRASRQVRIYQQYVEAYGLGYEVGKVDDLTVPGHQEVPNLEHATVPTS